MPIKCAAETREIAEPERLFYLIRFIVTRGESATGLPSTCCSFVCQVTVSGSTRVTIVVEVTL